MRLTTSTPHKNWRNCPAIPCNKPTRRATASAAVIPTAADVPPANTAPKNKTAAGGSLPPVATAACTSPSSAYTTAKPQAAAPPTKKYRSLADWANQTTNQLRANGFNGAGCWSSITEIRAARRRFSYCAYIEPMGKFRDALKAQGDFQGKVGWQGYPNDIIRVFDPRFDAYIEAEAKKLAQYANDPYLVGYFTDNELP